MKKLFATLLTVSLLAALSACAAKPAADPGTAGEAEHAAGAGLHTIGDALAVESEIQSSAYNEEYYICVFENNGVLTRTVAKITPEIYQALDEIDFFDEKKEEKINALIGDIPLERIDDLSAGIPTQEELDKLIGKTGQDLLDDGFEATGGHELTEEKTVFSLVKGLYEYEASFEEIFPTGDDFDFDDEEVVAGLTVKSVTYYGPSDHCTDMEYAEDPNAVY